MAETGSFRQDNQAAYFKLLSEHQAMVPSEERIKIDLHCHDHNSDVTDELLGRILRFPETWLTTGELIRCLKSNNCNAFTITNHNNARSCWNLLEKGEDILVGGEFSCFFNEFDAKLHVLAYGFTPEQEVRLNRLRQDIKKFLTYAAAQDIPTILPHPLYFTSGKRRPDPRIYEHLVLMFDRFEVLNGQRDVWQNLLTWEWLNSLDEEKIATWEKAHGIRSGDFCKNRVKKQVSGGSDDHMGLFAGACGTYLQVPGLKQELKTRTMADLALEAIRSGPLHPYGILTHHEKLNIAFIDYLSQIALNMNEPGLLRMFLHKGSLNDKLVCLVFSNLMQELRRHRFTMFFFKTLHEALQGKRPGLFSRWKISSEFKPLMAKIDDIAKARSRNQQQEYLNLLKTGSSEMYTLLNKVIAKRIKNKTSQFVKFDPAKGINTQTLIKKFEIPTYFRSLFHGVDDRTTDKVSQVNVSAFLDTLSFPALASCILAGASLISTRVLNNQREFVNQFARSIGKHIHPRRILWLTDTLKDQNGVSSSLSRKLAYIQEQDLPIDFLICSDRIEEEPHLKVVEPVGSFALPNYPDQKLYVPDLLAVKKIFIQGDYDRILCSTELMMGLAALFLKLSMAVPVYFYMHTDWMEFFEKTTEFDTQGLDRIRRMLRAFYRQFDRIFVMNQDHREWLTGPDIQYDDSQVSTSANWVDDRFFPHRLDRQTYFDGRVKNTDILILYAGRISREKGVFDLPHIMNDLRTHGSNVKLVIAGTGPAESRLKEQLPEAVFMGWVEREKMPELFSLADLLVLPSRFDTFGNVVLEAMSCGTAVAAYAVKGPKNIIQTQENGILADTVEELAQRLRVFVSDPVYRNTLKQNSFHRAKAYTPERIFRTFLRDLGLPETGGKTEDRLKMAIGY